MTDLASVSHGSDLLKALGIVLFTFASEDAATFTSGFLAATRVLSWPLAFTSCFLGIWLGDIGIYAAARIWGRPLAESLLKRLRIPSGYLQKSEQWFQSRGLGALILCRFIPWSRLPTFLMAGLLRVSVPRFLVVTGVMAFLWVLLIYSLVSTLGMAAVHYWKHWQGGVLAGLIMFVGLGGLMVFFYWLRKNLPRLLQQPEIQRFRQWEFWPGWLFYPPVIGHYFWLAIKYRGLTLPTVANPSIPTGGLVGESKYEILRELFHRQPNFVAEAFLVDAMGAEDRRRQFRSLLAQHLLTFPLVAKPDVGQRGVGFKILKDQEMGEQYVTNTPGRIVLQRYVPGPREVGVFYYRFPQETRGRILAITDKVFPVIIGDGQTTLEKLIRQNPRAAILASTYLQRFAAQQDRVLAPGEVFRLVEAGNHSQGCIFRNGDHLQTPELDDRIDQISQSLPGFFIGRYDLRYSSPEDLAKGVNFQIIELNGASSEITSIYDARNSLGQVYRTLFKQWDLVFAIGAENRSRGHEPDSLLRLWSEWQKFEHLSHGYPWAD